MVLHPFSATIYHSQFGDGPLSTLSVRQTYLLVWGVRLGVGRCWGSLAAIAAIGWALDFLAFVLSRGSVCSCVVGLVVPKLQGPPATIKVGVCGWWSGVCLGVLWWCWVIVYRVYFCLFWIQTLQMMSTFHLQSILSESKAKNTWRNFVDFCISYSSHRL